MWYHFTSTGHQPSVFDDVSFIQLSDYHGSKSKKQPEFHMEKSSKEIKKVVLRWNPFLVFVFLQPSWYGKHPHVNILTHRRHPQQQWHPGAWRFPCCSFPPATHNTRMELHGKLRNYITRREAKMHSRKPIFLSAVNLIRATLSLSRHA